METIYFSIIVPIYNVEKYLTECLQSVLKQSYQYYEIICINDASTDNSYDILLKYAKNNKKIIVINNKKNRGLSYCRNQGIEKAKGDYILFVDSDDYISSDMLLVLSTVLQEQGLDILEFNYSIKLEGEKARENNYLETGSHKKRLFPVSGKKWFTNAIKNNSMEVMAWCRAYKKDFLINNSLRFYETILHEDILFTVEIALKAKSVGSIDDCLYTYRRRDESITAIKCEKRLDSMIIVLNEILTLWNREVLDREMEDAIGKYLRQYCLPWIKSLMLSFPDHSRMGLGSLKDQTLYSILKYFSGENENQYVRFNKDELEAIKNSDKIIIYGAGNVAGEAISYMRSINKAIFAIAVSNKTNNKNQIAGYIIQQIDELTVYRKEALVIVAVIKRNQGEILLKLKEKGFDNILSVDTDRTRHLVR